MHYALTRLGLKDTVGEEEVYPDAIDAAAREVEEGRYEPEELEELVNKEKIIDRALALILPSE